MGRYLYYVNSVYMLHVLKLLWNTSRTWILLPGLRSVAVDIFVPSDVTKATSQITKHEHVPICGCYCSWALSHRMCQTSWIIKRYLILLTSSSQRLLASILGAVYISRFKSWRVYYLLWWPSPIIWRERLDIYKIIWTKFCSQHGR